MTTFHILSMSLHALRVVVPTMMMIFFAGTSELKTFLESIPTTIIHGLNIAGGIIVVVGYAMVINMMYTAHLIPFLYLGFIVAAFSNFNLIAIGSIGIIMSMIYVQLNPKYAIQELRKENSHKNLIDKKNSSEEDELD
ncbi:PTS system, mannose-specific IIC component [Candidatus Riesia pediculischaeffi PTSU]|uniref:PTS system, mannose-specific IIC component n=1 Tax=Candidatus Riesia pediculischaeffi PTSU TaxID=1401651 RepID=A0A0C1S9N1_9ENTR|nr:PTS system, mannose-specific IIC component [Candidatus Riesia pediculischaeffi PTSU]